ncbi:MAG: hypothetical protein GX535_15100, partial [Xanthomonadaceae bacterium]|nr:hypothetical protein [Xanthomonadaceae bacterium]
LGAIDRELARALRKEQRTWSPSERAALEDVRRAHSEAWEHCTREATRIDEVLLQMRLHRDGWMAYAMSDAHADLEKARR